MIGECNVSCPLRTYGQCNHVAFKSSLTKKSTKLPQPLEQQMFLFSNNLLRKKWYETLNKENEYGSWRKTEQHNDCESNQGNGL